MSDCHFLQITADKIQNGNIPQESLRCSKGGAQIGTLTMMTARDNLSNFWCRFGSELASN